MHLTTIQPLHKNSKGENIIDYFDEDNNCIVDLKLKN